MKDNKNFYYMGFAALLMLAIVFGYVLYLVRDADVKIVIVMGLLSIVIIGRQANLLFQGPISRDRLATLLEQDKLKKSQTEGNSNEL